jgi:signal transduction histidine kinase
MSHISTLIESGIKIRNTEPKDALGKFQSALKLSLDCNDPEFIAKSYFNCAIAQLLLANYPESLKNFNEALNCSYTSGDISLKAEILRGIATNYLRTYYYKEALKFLYLSEEASIESKNLENLNLVYGSFGSLYNRLKIYDKALEYTLKSLKVAEDAGDPDMRQYSIMSAGACYYQLGKLEKAIEYLTYAISGGENRFAEANALHFLSIIEFEKGNSGTAISYAERQLEISRKFNYHEYEALAYRLLGEIAYSQKNYNDALIWFQKGLDITDKVGEKLVNFSISRKLIDTYEKIGDTSNAAAINTMFKSLYERHIEHLEVQTQLKIEQIDIEYESARIKKDFENEKLNNAKLKKALDEVQQLNEKLEELNREKNDFMAVVIHDLKNPLLNIYSSARLINNGSEDDKKFAAEMTGNIVIQTERMFMLINRLLDYKAIDEGIMDLKHTRFKPDKICREVTGNMEILAAKKNQQLIYLDNLNGEIFNTDYMLLYQILENLLSNAIKFSPLGGKIYLRTLKDTDNVVIEVEDEGPGFSEKDLKKLYMNFARLSAKPTGKEHSSGLGLSIAMKLSKMLGLRLRLAEKAGKGAKFVIEIPYLTDDV